MCKMDGREDPGRDPATEQKILRRMELRDWTEFLELVVPLANYRARAIGLSGNELSEFCELCVNRVYRCAHGFEKGRNLRAWIAGICWKVAGERRRRLGRSEPKTFGVRAELVDEDSPLDCLLRQEELGWLEQRLANADPVTRTIFELRVCAGLDWRLIAEAIQDLTSLTAEGAKARHWRFVSKVKRELGVDD